MKIRLTKKLPHYPAFEVGSHHEVLEGKCPPEILCCESVFIVRGLQDDERVSVPLSYCEIDLTKNTPNSVREFFKLPRLSNVDHPSHYNTGKIECIDAIEASMSPEQFKGFLKGQVVKYIWRYEHKGAPAEDLRKAEWYLERLEEL